MKYINIIITLILIFLVYQLKGGMNYNKQNEQLSYSPISGLDLAADNQINQPNNNRFVNQYVIDTQNINTTRSVSPYPSSQPRNITPKGIDSSNLLFSVLKKNDERIKIQKDRLEKSMRELKKNEIIHANNNLNDNYDSDSDIFDMEL